MKQSSRVILWIRWSALLNSTDKIVLLHLLLLVLRYCLESIFTSVYGNILGGAKLLVQTY